MAVQKGGIAPPLPFLKKPDLGVKRRIIANAVGKEKSGKTNFGLTAPKPIAYMNFDYGLEGVIDKFDASKIWPTEYRINEIDPGKFVQEWERYKKEYRAILADKTIRTLITDTGTEMWELVRMARFGKLTQVMPHNYGPVNAEVRSLIREAYSSDKNVIFMHKMTERYVNEKPTGQYVMSGFKDIPYAVQVNLLMWREEGGGDFHCEITDCRQNPDLAGLDIVGENITFPNIAMMIFPNTTEEDWA